MKKCSGCARRREWFKQRLDAAKKRVDYALMTDEERAIAPYLELKDDKKD